MGRRLGEPDATEDQYCNGKDWADQHANTIALPNPNSDFRAVARPESIRMDEKSASRRSGFPWKRPQGQMSGMPVTRRCPPGQRLVIDGV